MVKTLIEVGLFDSAVDIVEQLLHENDENIELWYLAGVAYHNNRDNASAKLYLTRASEVSLLFCLNAT
jgi:hypothetical protein